MRPIKLALISTNALTRGGVMQMVAPSNPPIGIVGAFSAFQAASDYASQNIVDVILIDEALPPHTNLLREVKILARECRCGDHHHIAAAYRESRAAPVGVRRADILHKNDDLEQYLVQAIIWGRQRGIHLSLGVSDFVDTPKKLPAALSPRDLDVLKLLAEGMDPKEIALTLGIGSNSVYRIIRRLRDMLNAQNNAHLVTIIYESKLLNSQ